MIDFSIHRLFPDFILADKNGYAMAKAIERALQIMFETVQTGIDTVQNIDKMPEWRLDEMAWELGCLYDYNGNIENKRHWIKDATPLYSALGTPKAVYNFLDGFWDQVELEEHWQYSGDPFHFRVTVSGEWNDANETWLRRAIAASKNVRSVVDDIAIGSGTTIIVRGEGAELARFVPPPTNGELFAGTKPTENFIGKVSEVSMIAAPDAKGYKYPYPQAGTRPEENTVGAITDSRIKTRPETEGFPYPYQAASEEARTGTCPDTSTTYAGSESRITAEHMADGHVYPYPAASEDKKTVTGPQENTVGAQSEISAPATTDGKAMAFSYSPCTEDDPCGGDVI